MSLILNEPIFATFLTLFIGYWVSKFKFLNISIGSAAVFLCGFIFGMLGLTFSEHMTTLGLMIFMYAIGVHSGPAFFNSCGQKGLPYLSIAFFVSFFTLIFTYIVAKLFGFSSKEIILGIYTGTLNSSSSVAILYENGFKNEMLFCYGIVYPLGFVSVILFVQLLPSILKINVVREAYKNGYVKKSGDKHYIIRRKFKVKNEEVIGKKVHELKLDEKYNVNVARLYRNNNTFIVADNVRLQKNDILLLTGEEKNIEEAGKLIGREFLDDLALDAMVESRQIIINNPEINNTPIEDIGFMQKYHCVVSKIWRNGIELVPSGNFILQKGDVLTVIGNPNNLNKLENYLGVKKALTGEFDLFSISFAMVLTLLLSKIKFHIPYIGMFTFGTAGSAILIGMLFGYLTYIGKLKKNMSDSAEAILKELGLAIFLAGIGLKAGLGINKSINFMFISKLLLSSLLMIMLSMLSVFLVCRYILKMDFIKSLACVCGGFNNTPAILTLNNMIKSDEPISFFATIYPLALFAIIISSQILTIII